MSKTEVKRFETVQDFVDYTLNTPALASWQFAERHSRDTSRENWYGTKNIEEACKLAAQGWPEGLERMTKKMDMNLSKGRAKFRINDVAGDIPNIGRFLAGQPDSMTRRVVDQSIKKPIIDLTLNACFSFNVKAEHIMNYGAAIASAIDELEDAGFSVSLELGAINEYGKQRKGCMINIKKPSEPMDVDRMVFFVAHPSFFRRFCFSYWETVYESGLGDAGYGIISDFEKDDYAEGAIYFKSLNHLQPCDTVENARAFVRKIIKQQRPDLFADDAEAA